MNPLFNFVKRGIDSENLLELFLSQNATLYLLQLKYFFNNYCRGGLRLHFPAKKIIHEKTEHEEITICRYPKIECKKTI